MARTVSRPIDVPVDQGWPRAEVIDTNGDGGLAIIGSCCNTLYEQMRGPIIMDYDPDSIVDDDSLTARYRARIHGGSNLTERVKVYFCIEYDGAGSALTITATESSGPSAVTWTWPGGAISTPTWVAASGYMVARDDKPGGVYTEEWQEISVSSSETGGGQFYVYGVAIYYYRDRSALAAVSAGNAGYTDTGLVPIELTRLAGEMPASVARMLDMHAMLIYLYEDRVGQIITRAWVRQPPSSSRPLWWAADVPSSRGSDTLTARYYLYAYHATASDTITITGPDGSGSVLVGTTPAWVGPLDVSVTPSAEGGERPSLVEFTIDYGSSTTIESLCGYWRDATY